MTARPADNSIAASIQPQIDSLGEKMDRGFGELKEMMRGFDERLRKQETTEAACQPLVELKLNSAWKKLDEHDAKMIQYSETINLMARSVDKLYGIAKWLLGILTAMIISFLIALITGRVDLIIR